MSNTMEKETAIDPTRMIAGLKSLKVSADALKLAQFLVNTIGYKYSIMQMQAATATHLKANVVEKLFAELLMVRFIKQQARLKNQRTYAINRHFLDLVGDAADTINQQPSPEERRATFRLIKGKEPKD